MNRILLTEYRKQLLFGIWEKDRPVELALYEREDHLKLGDIVLARVRDIVPGLRAAFVQLTPDQTGFLPLDQMPATLHSGDELAVQITKEAQKTKDPVVTARLSLPGRLVVLTAGESQVCVSSKIHVPAWREQARECLLPLLPKDRAQKSEGSGSGDDKNEEDRFGFIIRTGAVTASFQELYEEAASLAAQYRKLRRDALTRTCFSRLRCSDPPWLSRLYGLTAGTNINAGSDETVRAAEAAGGHEKVRSPKAAEISGAHGTSGTEIVTDLPEIFRQCHDFLTSHNMAHLFVLRLYEDNSYPLPLLYRLDTVIAEATARRVWLKSGGYLVIEPTEAMVVIDVNTGKASGRREKEESILRLNLEAALETARQMRLRNLSGMILIDFIDMREKASQEQLISCLKTAVKGDPAGVTVVDMTKLGIVECTRRKTARPFYEQLARLHSDSHQ